MLSTLIEMLNVLRLKVLYCNNFNAKITSGSVISAASSLEIANNSKA